MKMSNTMGEATLGGRFTFPGTTPMTFRGDQTGCGAPIGSSALREEG